MLNNIYNSHSVWLSTLKNLGGAKQVQVHTKLSTVLDDAGNITSNRYLPSDLIKKYIYGKQSVNINELSGNDYYRAIGSAVIQGMSDISEFENESIV
jgi:hypothetical protein